MQAEKALEGFAKAQVGSSGRERVNFLNKRTLASIHIYHAAPQSLIKLIRKLYKIKSLLQGEQGRGGQRI